jgi:hypothetical protein
MLEVVIQDENGNALTNSICVPAEFLMAPEEPQYRCLCFVDPYGDTTFNQLQFAPLLDELARLRTSSRKDEAREAIEQVATLVARYRNTPHTYLKLIGDYRNATRVTDFVSTSTGTERN